MLHSNHITYPLEIWDVSSAQCFNLQCGVLSDQLPCSSHFNSSGPISSYSDRQLNVITSPNVKLLNPIKIETTTSGVGKDYFFWKYRACSHINILISRGVHMLAIIDSNRTAFGNITNIWHLLKLHWQSQQTLNILWHLILN